MTIAERFEGCILGGAIGDAWGSGFENQIEERKDIYYWGNPPEKKQPTWKITDDTQLTLATIEAMIQHEELSPESLALQFLKYFRQKKLSGIGASTLKALRELDFGGHWSQVGRRGEYAAGNGAAMRIAPLAFKPKISNNQIRDICIITHNNDEAYIGARSVIVTIRAILKGKWKGDTNLIEYIITQIPDTSIRDRFIEIKDIQRLSEIGNLGNNGYVVNSVPLAIAAANQINKMGIEKMFSQLIKIGGDTDTNCSIAGQIAGTLIGKNNLPKHLLKKLKTIQDFNWIQNTIQRLIHKEGW